MLLITSRGGKRWIVPKGIVEPGLSPQASAAKEALEEAGVTGDVADAAIGSYRRPKWGGICDVEVHPLLVSEELTVWAESSFRDRRWLSVPEAVALVTEDGLSTVIARLPEVAHSPGTFSGRLRPPQPQARLVYLLRHAQAALPGDSMEDFDRPLTPDGLTACRDMHRYLSMADVLPGLVLCSAAERARQTLDAVSPVLAGAPVVQHLRAIYQEGAKSLLRRLQQISPDLRRVMVVGHNPAVRSLAAVLTTQGHAADSHGPIDRFPAGSLAILAFPGDSWEELDEGSCELHSLVAPSDLQPIT